MKWWGHLCTINHHKWLVMKHCFAVGLYKQGLLHDLSKYTPVEFMAGAKYFQGSRSPNEAERLEKGYSAAWLHHKGRNKHHLEYWIDYSPREDFRMAGMKMPVNYVAEMVCDRIAASKTYRRGAYTDADPYEYFLHSRDHYLIHPETRALLEELLLMLRNEGEQKTFAHIRRQVLGKGG
ncbi:DUF5662 family protein [Anaerotruncus rubiinfantis]|uniref:DUF5662 family protein n=2 Tax=Anaerotruncus rubiinfantis TaxID=1720200 RepID=UPI00082C29A5|nr:DUF5662 family protein [Anaerotruncus rubiinfantis]